MDYSGKGLERWKRKNASRGTRIRHKISVFLFLFITVLIIGGVAIGGMYGYQMYQDILADTPDIDTIDATPEGYKSSVLDADGNVIAQLVTSGSNRVYATIEIIPDDLEHAFVAIEDERFYEHNGIDLKGIIRAAAKGVANGFNFNEGASTLTQQLLKNNVFDNWTSETKMERIERKVQEQYLAVQLEKTHDKDWIMENYLNTINLGQNTLGVQAAALRYFGKDVSELNLSECAVIAAITQNPSKYNPITHPENNSDRRATVLSRMKKQGYITEEQYNEAMEDDVYARIQTVNTQIESEDTTNVTSYFADAVIEQVLSDLQTELGYTEIQAYNMLYSGGLTVYSTQDSDVQKVCDEQINNDENYSTITSSYSISYALSIQNEDDTVSHYSEQSLLSYYKESDDGYELSYSSTEEAEAAVTAYKEYILAQGGEVLGESLVYTRQPQAACTVIDQYTGKVLAMTGGRGDKSGSLTLNRATDSLRQPGSTFKILSTYAPALESGEYTLATTVEDEEVTYSSGQEIVNADGVYRGNVTIREAIQESINTVAIKTIMDITPAVGYESLLQFGFTTLSEDDIVEAMPLGVASVSDLELTAAYAAIANGGVYNEPILYTKVVDHDGNVLLEKEQESHQAISATTAFLLTSAMQDVVSQGTGYKARFEGMAIAGKTGTAGDKDNARDSWFAGFTPYYTCVLWGGYDDNSELESRDFTKILWKAIMETLHEDLEYADFEQPEGIVRATICEDSGLRAGDTCTNIKTEYFAKGTVPSKTCSAHVSVKICTESGKLANEFCPEESVESQTFAKDEVPEETCDLHNAETYAAMMLEKGLNPDGTPIDDSAAQEPAADANDTGADTANTADSGGSGTTDPSQPAENTEPSTDSSATDNTGQTSNESGWWNR